MKSQSGQAQHLCQYCESILVTNAPFCPGCGMKIGSQATQQQQNVEMEMREFNHNTPGANTVWPQPNQPVQGVPIANPHYQTQIPPESYYGQPGYQASNIPHWNSGPQYLGPEGHTQAPQVQHTIVPIPVSQDPAPPTEGETQNAMILGGIMGFCFGVFALICYFLFSERQPIVRSKYLRGCSIGFALWIAILALIITITYSTRDDDDY